MIIQNESVYSPSPSFPSYRVVDVQENADDSLSSFWTYDEFGVQSGYAEASLATGSLRASSTAAYMTAPYDSILTLGSTATMGDSFSLLDSMGAPFVVSGDTATFNLAVTGFGEISGGVPGRTPQANALIELFVLKAGSLDKWVPNSYGLFTPNTDDIINVFQWGATPTSTSALDYSTYGTTYETHLIPVLSNGDVATATFDALESFDWIIRLNASIYLPSGDPDAWAGSDFANTVNVSFAAPQGAITASASGVFPETVAAPVPEAESWAMMLAGLGLIGGVIQRRKNKST